MQLPREDAPKAVTFGRGTQLGGTYISWKVCHECRSSPSNGIRQDDPLVVGNDGTPFLSLLRYCRRDLARNRSRLHLWNDGDGLDGLKVVADRVDGGIPCSTESMRQKKAEKAERISKCVLFPDRLWSPQLTVHDP